MSREDQALQIAARIGDFFQQAEASDAAFNALALEIFAYQFAFNAPYRRFCDGRGVTPAALTDWREIPPAPAAAFKHYALTCAPEALCLPENGGRIFHSSGTTQADTSRHFMDSVALNIYRQSLKAAYAHFTPWTAGVFALMPPPKEAPHSSLSYMLETLDAQFKWQEFSTWPLAKEKYSWTQILYGWFRVQRKPYTLFGTAFAFVNLLDGTDETFKLPEECLIVETGGFKGKSREVSRDELYAMFTDRLGVALTHCISEYGMSEMASQFYDSTYIDHARNVTRPVRKVAPHWLKTRVMDPITGQEAKSGKPGLLAHYDLANLNSVLAIQTEDYGIAAEDGDGLHLLGRAPGAILRGCSLTAEEMFETRSSATAT